MYPDHEGNRTGDISPSWGQPNTRVHTALSRRRARQGPGEGDGTNVAFMPPRTMKILGEGRPRGPRRGGGRTTDVARQHDTGRPQGDKNSGGLNPAPGEHTRWAVLSLVRYIVLKHILCAIFYILCSIFYILYSIFYILYSIFYILYSIFYILHLYASICIYMHLYASICIYMYMHTYVYVYIYTYTSWESFQKIALDLQGSRRFIFTRTCIYVRIHMNRWPLFQQKP